MYWGSSTGTYTLTYLLPRTWLASSERSYPVALDPVITAELSTSNIREIPALTSSDVVVSAFMQMQKIETSNTTSTVQVHKVLGTWESESITWANKPGFDPTIEDYQICKNIGTYGWDVTDIVRGWYAGTNTGMMFKANDAVEAAQTNNWKQFYSSDYSTYAYQPALAIVFRNNNGLESYWDYTASPAGRAGTGYINDFTGNLVWTRGDLGFGGNRMPVSISHVYNADDAAVPADDNNSNDSGGNYFGLGSGWRTNYHQRLYRWSKNNSYYVWEDGDGTDHYFTAGSDGVIMDEDGLELTLTVSSSGYTLTDKQGGKSSTYTYSGNLLTDAQDIDGYKLQYTYNTTAAGKHSWVSSIREYDGSVAGGHLTIEYAHNQTTFADQVNGTKLIKQFNDFGNTVCVQDDQGRAQYAKYARSDKDDGGKGNQLKLSSNLQNTVVTAAKDNSFENGVNWTASNASVSCSVSSGAAYYGTKSLYVTASAEGYAKGNAFNSGSGTTCTVSAYVKVVAGTASLGVLNGSTVTKGENLSAGGWTLATYSYTTRNNYLSRMTYGNGDYIDYSYDQYGNVLSQTYEDGDALTYAYDNDGVLATVTDSATGITTTYYYDFTGRTVRYTEKGPGHSKDVQYGYDSTNNLTTQTEVLNGVTRTTSYTYDEDNRVLTKKVRSIT